MAKEKVTPTCRYGHGEMAPTRDPDWRASRWASLHMSRINNEPELTLNTGMAYGYLIYECPVCTYLEFHDDMGVE